MFYRFSHTRWCDSYIETLSWIAKIRKPGIAVIIDNLVIVDWHASIVVGQLWTCHTWFCFNARAFLESIGTRWWCAWLDWLFYRLSHARWCDSHIETISWIAEIRKPCIAVIIDNLVIVDWHTSIVVTNIWIGYQRLSLNARTSSKGVWTWSWKVVAGCILNWNSCASASDTYHLTVLNIVKMDNVFACFRLMVTNIDTNLVATITLSVSLVPYQIVLAVLSCPNWNTDALDSLVATRNIGDMNIKTKVREIFNIDSTAWFAFLLSKFSHGYITSVAIVAEIRKPLVTITTDNLVIVDWHASIVVGQLWTCYTRFCLDARAFFEGISSWIRKAIASSCMRFFNLGRNCVSCATHTN